MFTKKLVSPFISFVSLFATLGLHAQDQNLIEKNVKHNIIFLLTEDQRFDAIGYVGNKYVETPEMDNLANSGAFLLAGSRVLKLKFFNV